MPYLWSCERSASPLLPFRTDGTPALFAPFPAAVTVNTQASQNALRLGSATSGVLYTPAATNVPINPTIVSAVLTATDKVVVRLPASSTFQESECAATFTVRSAGGAVKSPIASCAITNGTIVTISITAGSYAAGDSIDVANSGTNLRVGTTPYAPRTAPVIIRPTMLAAYYASAGQLWISLPARSSGPSPFTPADCNAALEVTNGNTTKPNAVAGCSLSADGMTLSVDLASTDAFAPGKRVSIFDVVTDPCCRYAACPVQCLLAEASLVHVPMPCRRCDQRAPRPVEAARRQLHHRPGICALDCSRGGQPSHWRCAAA